MKFHVEFRYKPSERESLLRHLHVGGLESNKILGAWVAAQTGIAYALVETNDAKLIYDMCADLTMYGEISIVPVISIEEL